MVVNEIDLARTGITGEAMEQATKTFENTAVNRAIAFDKLDGRLKAAFTRMTANTKSGKVTRTGKHRCGRPHGPTLWLFNQVANGSAKPWKHITEGIVAAMEAGAKEEDVMCFINELGGYVRGFYMQRELMPVAVAPAICLEASTDAAQDVALAVAATSPTVSNLERLLETSVAHERAEENLVAVVRGHLALARC